MFRLQAAQFVSICKFLVILCVLASFNPFPFLGQDTPGGAAWMLENKIYACMMTFFLCNAVETQVGPSSPLKCKWALVLNVCSLFQLISTGAFEISLNDMPVWSKIESGRIPQPGELFQIIDNHMGMRGGGGGGNSIGLDDFHDEL